MTESQLADTIDLERLVRVLRRRWALIVLCLIVSAGAAFGLSKLQTKKYSATAAVLFSQSQLDQLAVGLTPTASANPVQDTATDFALLTAQGSVPERVAQAVGQGVTAAQLRNDITVAPEGSSSIADVTATTTNPVLAAKIANSFATQFIALRRAQATVQLHGILNLLQKQVAALTPPERASTQGQELISRIESLQILSSLQTGDAQLVRQATVPGSPSSPQPRRDAALGAVVGLLIGLMLLLVLERLDRRVRTVHDLELAVDVPLLGAVPHIDLDAAGQEPVAGANGETATVLGSAAAMEAFRMLRAHLRYFNIDRDVRVVLIASEVPGEGKTLVSCHLAEAAASMGNKVLLLEADLRRASIAPRFHLDPVGGLADVLIGTMSMEEAVTTVTVQTRGGETRGRLDVVAAGAHPPNPARLLESDAMASLLETVRAEYDLVVIDTTPLSVVSDAIPLTRHVDGVILVGRIGYSTRDGSRRMLDRLQKLNAPVLGVVANDVSQQAGYGYGYGYGAGYYRAAEAAAANGSALAAAEARILSDSAEELDPAQVHDAGRAPPS